MLLVVHGLVGATLGSLVGDVPGKEVIAFGIGWASHYVLDSIPHWERFYRPFQKFEWEATDPFKKWPRHVFIQAVLDALLFCLIIIWLSVSGAGNLAMIFGALGAIIPDLLDNVPFWRHRLRKYKLFKYGYEFHKNIHVTYSNQDKYRLLGFASQFIIVLGALWILF